MVDCKSRGRQGLPKSKQEFSCWGGGKGKAFLQDVKKRVCGILRRDEKQVFLGEEAKKSKKAHRNHF